VCHRLLVNRFLNKIKKNFIHKKGGHYKGEADRP
jgi:hypothetical protein